MKQLRPYQAKAVNQCREALNESDQPTLLMASVGSGKSLMIAEVLLKFELLSKYALCITHNAELVRNNAKTYLDQGGNPGIYCAAMKRRDEDSNVIFASVQSIINAIKKGSPISKVLFNIIVVDECHMVNHTNISTTFMRVINHYKHQYPPMRVLGMTGTPFRFKGDAIVGDDKFYKRQVGNITMKYLIDRGFLVKPIFLKPESTIDFSELKAPSRGFFNAKDLNRCINKSPRLTFFIMKNLTEIVEKNKRGGVFVFASSLAHVQECLDALPNSARAITGETPTLERNEILRDARAGKVKYLVNVNVLTVGIDVPNFDMVCYVRPTESLVLMIQTLGRGLRLAPGKSECWIYDCAGNVERHADWDDPVINDALRRHGEEEDYNIPCVSCGTLNKISTRRCIGEVNGSRCDHYFIFRECGGCRTQNDVVARECRKCGGELINPNDKLLLKNGLRVFKVTATEYVVKETPYGAPILIIKYKTHNNTGVTEKLALTSDKAKHYFHNNFVRPLLPQGVQLQWETFRTVDNLRRCLQSGVLNHAKYIVCKLNGSQWKVVKRRLDMPDQKHFQ